MMLQNTCVLFHDIYHLFSFSFSFLSFSFSFSFFLFLVLCPLQFLHVPHNFQSIVIMQQMVLPMDSWWTNDAKRGTDTQHYITKTYIALLSIFFSSIPFFISTLCTVISRSCCDLTQTMKCNTIDDIVPVSSRDAAWRTRWRNMMLLYPHQHDMYTHTLMTMMILMILIRKGTLWWWWFTKYIHSITCETAEQRCATSSHQPHYM